jgi:hypothetical protein
MRHENMKAKIHRSTAENIVKFATWVSFLIPISLTVAGCTAAILDRTAPMTEIPLQITHAKIYKDEVIIEYNAQLRSESGQLLWEEGKCASFDLIHKEGIHQIAGKRIPYSQTGNQDDFNYIPIVSPKENPINVLSIYPVVVWGASFDSSDVYIVEKTESGEIGWTECTLHRTERDRGWQGTPTRVVLIPFAVLIDFITVGLMGAGAAPR